MLVGQITAETVSALLDGFGHTAEMELSAETAIFGRKKLVSAKIFECHSVKLVLLIQGTTNFRFWCFGKKSLSVAHYATCSNICCTYRVSHKVLTKKFS